MKNKKRLLGLALGLVLVLLVIGCFTVGSVDYEKAEEDIETIEYARIESRKLYIESLNMGKSIWLNCDYNEVVRIIDKFDKIKIIFMMK